MAYKITKPVKEVFIETKKVKVEKVEVKAGELQKDYKAKGDAIITNPTVG